MKSHFLVSLLLLIFTITIPSSFEDLKNITAESALTLNEQVHQDIDDFNVDDQTESSEKEVEDSGKELLVSSFSKTFIYYSSFNISSRLPVFISTYIASFHVPPTA